MKKYLVYLLALMGIHQHLSAEQRQDLANAAVHVTPGAAATGVFKVWGLPLSDWLVVASLAFIALQAGYLVWKWRQDYQRAQQRQRLARLAGLKPEAETDWGAP